MRIARVPEEQGTNASFSFLRRKRKPWGIFSKTLVPKGGLEPPHLTAYAPQTYVSTNSTTWANLKAQYFKPGAPSRVRTYNQRFRRPLLFQLSYGCESSLPEQVKRIIEKISKKANYFTLFFQNCDGSTHISSESFSCFQLFPEHILDINLTLC